MRTSTLLLLVVAPFLLAPAAVQGGFVDVRQSSFLFGPGPTWGGQAIDIDHDGDVDILNPHHALSVLIFTNNGSGVFSPGGIPQIVQSIQDRHGFLWADLDLDGFVDVVCSHGGSGGCGCTDDGNELWKSLGGGNFQVVPNAGGMLDPVARGRAFSAADVDGDGDLDLHHSVGPLASEPNSLWRNDGSMTFVDVASDWGVDEVDGTVGAIFGDYDDDGDPDFLVGGEEFTRPTVLWRNDGSDFVDVTAAAFGSLPVLAGADWGDYDNDGDLDLAICEGLEGVYDTWAVDGNDYWFFANHRGAEDGVDIFQMESVAGDPQATLQWRGLFTPDKVFLGPAADTLPSAVVTLTDAYVGAPTFTPGVDHAMYVWRESAGGPFQFHVSAPPGAFGNFSATLVTQNGVTNTSASNLEQLVIPPGQARVYRNDGGVFAEVSGALGLTASINPRAVTWVDFDNDGDLDLHQVNKGTVDSGNEADILWRNDGSTFFALQGAPWVPGDSLHVSDGGAWADIDGDGDLDLFLQEGTGATFFINTAQPFLYRNDGPNGGFLSVELGFTASGGTSVGARATCHAGALEVHRRLRADTWRGFQGPLALHFGLGAEAWVDSLVIEWPSGGIDVVGPLPANRTIELEEGDTIGLAASVDILTATPDSIAPQQAGSVLVEVTDSMGARLSGESANLSMSSLQGLVNPGAITENPDSTYTLAYVSKPPTGLDSLVVTDSFPEPAVSDTLVLRVTHFPDQVAISSSASRFHWGDSVTLGASILDGTGDRVPDEGAAVQVTSLLGYGTVGSLTIQADSSYAASYDAAQLTGTLVDQIEVFDPEAATTDRDTTFVEITDTAIIASVTDVGNDQGRQVRVIWQRDLHDTAGAATPIDHYIVWRRADGSSARTEMVLSELTAERMTRLGRGESLLRAFQAVWEPVGPVVPARVWDQYASVVPTLVDSTASGGIAYSVFFLTAHTTDPGTFFSSAPDSGYSVDNLSPGMPAGLQLEGHTLTWEPAPEPDFRRFAVYGSGEPDFAAAERIAYTVAPLFDAAGLGAAVEPSHAWYFVTAIDRTGNESPAARAESGATSSPDVAARPTAFLLYAPSPNPFSASATITFDLPTPADVHLSIYDVAGRWVETLVRGRLPSGHHSYAWSTAAGGTPPGVYFVRLDAGLYSASRKIVRLR